MAFTRRETAVLILGDFLILGASLWAALTLRNLAIPSAGYFETVWVQFLPVFFLSLVIFYIAGLYEKPTRFVRRVMGERVLGAQAANTLIAAVLFFALPFSIAPKTILALYLLVSVVAISSWRFYRSARERSPEARTKAVLVGSGEAVREVFDEANANSRSLLRFVKLIDPETTDTLIEAIEREAQEGCQLIVLDTKDKRIFDVLPQIYRATAGRASFMEFSSLYEDMFDKVSLAHIDYAWLLARLPGKRAGAYDFLKRLLDITGALVGGILSISFVVSAVLALSLSGGTPFIRAERIGKEGRIIRLLKLRTMLFNDRGDPELRTKNRVTRLGSFLRRTRIDELPQLWNVLMGELSFIGPRPEYPALAAVYEREIPYYHARLLITPGISGWAQIRDYDVPRHTEDVERTRRKLSYDLYYLKHRSFGLDISIALKTLRTLVSLSGT